MVVVAAELVQWILWKWHGYRDSSSDARKNTVVEVKNQYIQEKRCGSVDKIVVAICKWLGWYWENRDRGSDMGTDIAQFM